MSRKRVKAKLLKAFHKAEKAAADLPHAIPDIPDHKYTTMSEAVRTVSGRSLSDLMYYNRVHLGSYTRQVRSERNKTAEQAPYILRNMLGSSYDIK